MTKRSFPDVNVWFALAVADHPHHRPALAWWSGESSLAGFCHLTQLGLLRLLTTASAMGGQPLTNEEAWRVYDGFYRTAAYEYFRRGPGPAGVSTAIWSASPGSPAGQRNDTCRRAGGEERGFLAGGGPESGGCGEGRHCRSRARSRPRPGRRYCGRGRGRRKERSKRFRRR
jgi:hypothetical protein